MSALQRQNTVAPALERESHRPAVGNKIPRAVTKQRDNSHSKRKIYHTDSDGTKHVVHYPLYLPSHLVEVLRDLASGNVNRRYEYLTIAQTAAILFTSEDRVQELVSDGTLAAYTRNDIPMIRATEMFTYKCERDRQRMVNLRKLIANDIDLL